MAGPIQTIAPGLLGLLQLKQTGKNPETLAEIVAPVIEMRDWYMQARNLDDISLLPGVTLSVNVPTAGKGNYGYANAVVPNGQIWWVTHYWIVADLLAAETIRLAPCLLRANGNLVGLSCNDVNDVVTARVRGIVTTAINFWAKPGDQFGVRVFDSLTAANIAVAAGIRATPMQV